MHIPVGYAQVNFRFVGQAVPTGAEVTFGLALPAPSTTLTQAADDISVAATGAGFESIIENDSDLASFLLKFGPNETGPSAEFPIAISGTAGADGTVPNVAALVRKINDGGGRRSRARLYWPFVMSNWVDDGGNIGVLTAATISEKWNNFRTSLEASDYTLVVLHAVTPDSGQTVEDLPPPFTILSFETSTLAATQRRRLRR